MEKGKRLMAMLMILCLLISCLAGCGAGGDGQDAASADNSVAEDASEGYLASGEGETFVYGMGSSWDTLFPYGGTAEDYGKTTWGIMYSKLVYVDGNDNFVDSGIVYGESSVSEDGMSITFQCNPDLTWSDGEPVTAEDWVYTFETITDPSLVCTRKNYFNIFAGVDESGNLEEGCTISDVITADGDTFTVYLDDATNLDSFLYAYNDYFYLMPKHCLEDTAAAEVPDSDFWEAPVTSGPWVLEEEIEGSQITFCRNAYFPYWDSYSNISNFVLRVVGTDVMVEGIAAGELHNVMSTMSAGDCAEAVEIDGVSGETLEEPTSIVIMAINLQKLTDSRVRRALDYALNREYLCEEVMGGQAIPVNTFERSKYLNPDIVTEYSLDKAKELLDEAAADGTFDYSTPLTIGVVTGFREQIASVLKEDLASIGVTLDIVTGDGTTILGQMQESGAYDLCLVGGGLGADATWPQNDYFNPAISNYGQLDDSKYYDLCMAINAETDEDTRMEMIYELQEMVYEEAPYVFVFNMVAWRLYSSYLVFENDDTSQAFSNTSVSMPWNIRIEY